MSIPVSDCQVVISGYNNKLKNIEPTTRAASLKVAITGTARIYGMRKNVDGVVITECAEIMNDKFSLLGIEEITEAYRLWSIGSLDLGRSAEMYGGEFNAAQFGKIMGAYVEYRKKILAAYLNAKHEQEFEAEKAEVKRKQKEHFEEHFEEMFLNAEFESWEEVPAFWCDAARKRGLMKIEKANGLRIWERAKKLALIKIEEEKATSFNAFSVVAEGGDRAKVIAKQIAVFEYLKNLKK